MRVNGNYPYGGDDVYFGLEVPTMVKACAAIVGIVLGGIVACVMWLFGVPILYVGVGWVLTSLVLLMLLLFIVLAVEMTGIVVCRNPDSRQTVPVNAGQHDGTRGKAEEPADGGADRRDEDDGPAQEEDASTDGTPVKDGEKDAAVVDGPDGHMVESATDHRNDSPEDTGVKEHAE